MSMWAVEELVVNPVDEFLNGFSAKLFYEDIPIVWNENVRDNAVYFINTIDWEVNQPRRNGIITGIVDIIEAD